MPIHWITCGVVVFVLVGLTGCGTVEGAYRPQTIGALHDGQAREGLTVQLKANNSVIQIGTPAVFSVVVRNTGDKAFWIPKKPQQAFFWTYPNGRRDCYMIDREETRFFQKSDCMLLAPGREFILGGLVETSYFDRPGITEFMAEINVPKNTNPELSPFWSGRGVSNAYGLQMMPFKVSNVR